jgi:DNA-binding NarL/FixJ family response regulator
MARNLVTSADEVETAAPATALTEREKLILTLIASGRSLKEISQELAIGSTTLRNHISHINRKLGTNSRLSAALRAIKNGLI